MLTNFNRIDTNVRMNRDGLDTRNRLSQAAAELFAEHGYLGASVRDICNLAGTNPGAVSYHFGGKRQLYRTVLRQAADQLAAAAGVRRAGDGGPESGLFERIPLTAKRLLRLLEDDPVPARLLLRDLADGGGVAVEALAPTLRSAYDAVRSELGMADLPRQAKSARLVFLRLAAPLFLATAAWPVLEQALELAPGDREDLLVSLLNEAFN